MTDSAEETSTCDGSSEGAMGGEGQRVSDEGLKDLPDKVQKDDPKQLEGREFTKPAFVNYNIQEDTCKISGCFAGVTFDDCLLLDNTKITDCCMINVTFRGCTFTRATWAELHLEDVTFEECTFEHHLWRCRSLHNGYIKKADIQVETSLGEEIPPETNMAVWVEQQQQAEIAASLGDEGYARYIRAQEEKEHDRQLAPHLSAEGHASIEWMPDAKACQDPKFQAEDAARRARWVPSPMNSWG
ncbi:hypothetical protein KC356_g4786 [Hortaea werneckii]|nr:hypothetical protein KC356_g4786 [Hortaea werneckii]